MQRKPRYDYLTAQDQLSRATQSGSLLQIVLDLVDNLRPDLLREMHGRPVEHAQRCLRESATPAPPRWTTSTTRRLLPPHPAGRSFVRTSAAVAADGGLDPPDWNTCIQKHRGVVLKWYTIILAEQPQDTLTRTLQAARSVVDNISAMITGISTWPARLRRNGCLLQLFMWVNKDTGAVRDDPQANVMSGTKTSSQLRGVTAGSLAHSLNPLPRFTQLLMPPSTHSRCPPHPPPARVVGTT